MVGTTSSEYPSFTGDESNTYDDTLSWEITPSTETSISGGIHVNERHDDWIVDEINGVTLNNLSPVHIEKVKVIQATSVSDVTVTVNLTATNVSDGQYPSTVIVGLLPVRIEPDEMMAGTVGDMTESNKGQGGERHFVSPKKSTEIDQEHVNLRATHLEPSWITAGDSNQLVEWVAGVGESNGNVMKWKVKRDATDKLTPKIRTIAKHGAEEAAKLNVWVTWADLVLLDGTPKLLPPSDSGIIFNLNAKISYKYTCHPNDMFDLLKDIPNFNLTPAPPAPGGNHAWPQHLPLSGGSAIRYDATRQVRAVLTSSDPVLLDIEHAITPNIDYPVSIAEGNDDPTMGGETMPYEGPEGRQAIMNDVDSPTYPLLHALGLPNTNFQVQAQFRQYARIQIAGKWYQCSNLELSVLKFKFKKFNGKWTDDDSTFVLGN